jgi:2-(1,2-epoxy-1,2-dihydrophenyl)acetyl-CoA isomerase
MAPATRRRPARAATTEKRAMADLDIQREGRVVIARLNRPEKKNAQSEEMLDLLCAALRSANKDPDTSCFIITGAGDAFCSGGDMGRRAGENAAPPTPLERMTRLQTVTHQVARTVEEFDKPLIAAVNGAAVGAGMDMALMCDIRYAARSARFAEAYVKVGLIPGNGACWFLPRIVGVAKALELLWTGDFVGADEALRIGLVSKVCDDATLLDETLAFASRLAEGPPIQQREIKKLLYQSLHTDLRTSLRAVAAHMAVIQSTDDYREAVEAFKAKRKPDFKGR